jgi:glutamate/tyrosine decarboxylase-like PLP-dependent enzyme
LRIVPVNAAFEIDVEALQAAISADRLAGHAPFCVVGAAGTTNTGSMDDLEALADLCEREKLWLHVDGAFGAWAALSPAAKHLVAGMERADSLALDLHKWMYMPYEIGCVLVQRPDVHRATFALMPAYLVHGEGGRGLAGGDLPWFSDYGFQLSRGFRALKAWMSLKEHGSHKYGRLIQQNIDQARYLAERVAASPELELAAPTALNVVCFRYVRAELDETTLNELNKHVVVELQEQGIAVPSGTMLNGRYVIHVANTNHRSRRADFDLLVREVVRLGQAYAARGR